MASLIIQDTFDPYYAGREEDAEARAKPRRPSKKPVEGAAEGEIVLPEAAPAPSAVTRRERRIVAH